MGHIAAADDFALHGPRSAILVGLKEINGLALIEGKEQLLRDGIIAVVLLENLKMTAWAGHRVHGTGGGVFRWQHFWWSVQPSGGGGHLLYGAVALVEYLDLPCS